MSTIYIPLVMTSGPTEPTPPVVDDSDLVDKLAYLFVTDKGQQRQGIEAHEILGRVAMDRAKDMIVRHYYDHTDPDGHGPNWHVRQAGYRLPFYYGAHDTANNIESIYENGDNPEHIWQGWLDSPPHRVHVLGEGFYAGQTRYGIGYAHNDSGRHMWVLITAPPMEWGEK